MDEEKKLEKKGIEFERLIDGGHQENNKRAGTENVAEIVGLGKACEIAKQSEFISKHIPKSIIDIYCNR